MVWVVACDTCCPRKERCCLHGMTERRCVVCGSMFKNGCVDLTNDEILELLTEEVETLE